MIGDASVSPCDTVKDLGVTFDSQMSMNAHISIVCRTAFYHLRNISRIRKYLTASAVRTLVQTAVISRLDYGNALLYGLPDCSLKRLQNIQNAAARVIMQRNRRHSVTPLLKELHWLPVKNRIKYKVLLLAFKGLHQLAPSYLSSLLEVRKPAAGRFLRSSTELLLKEQRTRLKTWGDRAFQAAAAREWNKLPREIRHVNELSSFKKILKTHLFRDSYP